MMVRDGLGVIPMVHELPAGIVVWYSEGVDENLTAAGLQHAAEAASAAGAVRADRALKGGGVMKSYT